MYGLSRTNKVPIPLNQYKVNFINCNSYSYCFTI